MIPYLPMDPQSNLLVIELKLQRLGETLPGGLYTTPGEVQCGYTRRGKLLPRLCYLLVALRLAQPAAAEAGTPPVMRVGIRSVWRDGAMVSFARACGRIFRKVAERDKHSVQNGCRRMKIDRSICIQNSSNGLPKVNIFQFRPL